MVDIRYSQNLYTNKSSLQRLISNSGINADDIVLDIGAGRGIITEELSKYAKKVIAYELDDRYYEELKLKFDKYPNVFINKEDFLNTELPKEKFKIFSNIPFSITSDIVNKIADINSELQEAFLFVQKESAERYLGIPKGTQISTILSFMYEVSIFEELYREDFRPIPSVDVVLLSMKSKGLDSGDYELYRDFVTYIFNQMNGSVLDTFKKLFTFNQLKYIREYLKKNNYSKPTDIPSDYYIDIFQRFKTNGDRYMKVVKGYYVKHLDIHSSMEKVHRSR